jgi:hypothetical protein
VLNSMISEGTRAKSESVLAFLLVGDPHPVDQSGLAVKRLFRPPPFVSEHQALRVSALFLVKSRPCVSGISLIGSKRERICSGVA